MDIGGVSLAADVQYLSNIGTVLRRTCPAGSSGWNRISVDN